MRLIEDFKTLLRYKDRKKLMIFSIIVFLIIAATVFYFSFTLCLDINLKLMDEFLWEIPKITESRINELALHSTAYEDDILTQAEVGLLLYQDDTELAESEKLEWVREAVSADSVSVINDKGSIIHTTGPVIPREIFLSCVQTLEPNKPHLELFPEMTEDGEATGKTDGCGLVRLAVSDGSKSSLVFEFSSDFVLSLHNGMDNWESTLQHMLSGEDVSAYVMFDGMLRGYPAENLESKENAGLRQELTAIFQDSGSFQTAESGRRFKIITLRGQRVLAMLEHYSYEGQEEADILLTVPLINAIGNGIFIAASITVLIGLGMLLIQLYIFRHLRQAKDEEGTDSVSAKNSLRLTWPGFISMLLVTIIFITMLFTLESRSFTSVTTDQKLRLLQREIDWGKAQEESVRKNYMDYYRTRTQVLAAFLEEHPDYCNKSNLTALNRIARASFLMLFDSNGDELVSSNSYTGFSVGKNPGENFRAVLMGYPYVIAGPELDSNSGEMQLAVAIMMSDREGQANGFLMAVYDAWELDNALKQMSCENTVNNYAVREGQAAAAVNEEDGRFTAHTDHTMIGKKALDSMPYYQPGVNYEGFTVYNEHNVCMSKDVENGIGIMFIMPMRSNSNLKTILLLTLAVLFLELLYYLYSACSLIAKIVSKADGKPLPGDAAEKKPIALFFDGCAVFMTLFAFFALTASYNGWWTSFEYVFNGSWTRSVNLYSLWAALFILAVAVTFNFLVRSVLQLLEKRLTLQSRTVTRLIGSLITYIISFFLIFCILSIFGVNTTVLLASAGIVSIAVGMGAQSMAADLLAGFFMMLEGSIHVGDRVSVGGTAGRYQVTGQVTDMGIRTTEITDDEGNVVILNNSKVSPINNMSRNKKPQDSLPQGEEKPPVSTDRKD